MSVDNGIPVLKGQVAIVTGGSRGIGAACAYALARAGAHITIVDLLAGDEMAARITSAFPDVQVVTEQVDVRQRTEVKKVIDRTFHRWGRIDIVINNAGTCCRLDLETITDEEWERDINTNLKGTFLFTQMSIYPYMKEQGYGKIVNISSVSGIMGGVTSSLPESNEGRSGAAYAASKGGVIAFTKWVAKEVGKYGITCNSVAPGAVETELTKGMNYPLDNQPIKRVGQPEDIAEAVLYMSSPSSNYVTGQVLRVCGGLVIG